MLSHAPALVACEAAPDLICSVCLDTWKHPVMLRPCEHVYCESCVASLRHCPDCRKSISERSKPHRILQQIAEQVRVTCEGCGWCGSRSESYDHRCFQLPRSIPQGESHAALPSTTRRARHEFNQQELAAQLAAYFVAFGGRSSESSQSVSIDREGFCDLLECLNYATDTADLNKIYDAVRATSTSAPRGDVTVGMLMQFLEQYPADPKRLYHLSVIDYHSCVYQLWLWLSRNRPSSSDGGRNLHFTPLDFAQFVRRHSYQSVLDAAGSPPDDATWVAKYLPLIDVCDGDGSISRHEALRFMSSCIRGVSILEENVLEGYSGGGGSGRSPGTSPAGASPTSEAAQQDVPAVAATAAAPKKGHQKPTEGRSITPPAAAAPRQRQSTSAAKAPAARRSNNSSCCSVM